MATTITVTPITITPMDFEDIINNIPSINNSGYFIETMKSLNEYIKGEFDKGRITGNDYAQVYIAAMQYALQNSFQYEIEQHKLQFEYAKTQEELELLRAQAAKARKETELLDEQLLLAQATHQASIDKAYTEVSLIQKKLITETKQQALLEAQATKLGAESSLVSAKTNTETDQQNVLKAQSTKLSADTSLANAKTTTEADTQKSIKAQTAVYGQQALGFKANHNIKTLNALLNVESMIIGKASNPAETSKGIHNYIVDTTNQALSTNIKNLMEWPTSVPTSAVPNVNVT